MGDFEVKKKEGITWIKWNDVQGLLVPVPEATSSETGANMNAGPTGFGAGAKLQSNWRGGNIFLIYESGQTTTYDVWAKKKEIEAGLAASGIVTSISSVGTISGVIGESLGVSMKAEVVPNARTEKWKCEKCGMEIEPNVSHSH